MSKTFIEIFNETIPDDAGVFTIKINKIDVDDYAPDLALVFFRGFLEEQLKLKILYCSSGIHLQGENKVPHIHVHFITSYYKLFSNMSVYRKRYENKGDISLGENVTMQFKKIEPDNPKYHTLSYPLKEGIRVVKRGDTPYLIPNNLKMPEEMIVFLQDVGNGIYQKNCADNERRDKSDNKKKRASLELLDLCQKNRGEFSDYRSMIVWLETNYIETLAFLDKPKSRNYETDCETVAVQLKLIRMCDLIRQR